MCVMDDRMHLEWTMHQVMQSGLQSLQILRLVGLPWFVSFKNRLYCRILLIECCNIMIDVCNLRLLAKVV